MAGASIKFCGYVIGIHLHDLDIKHSKSQYQTCFHTIHGYLAIEVSAPNLPPLSECAFSGGRSNCTKHHNHLHAHIFDSWHLLKSVYWSRHLSPSVEWNIHKYFNFYGSVHGSDHQGTGTGLLRTELRVQFLVLEIFLWTWPNWTLTALIVIEIMDHCLCVTIDQVHWLFAPRISPYGPYGPTIHGMSQGCLGWSRTILLLSLDFLLLHIWNTLQHMHTVYIKKNHEDICDIDG